MRQDAEKLQAFYATRLGKVAGELLSAKLASLWPNADKLSMLGYGYAAPVLEGKCGGAQRVISAMPEGQGAVAWSQSGRGCDVTLVPESRLPFSDQQFDRTILMHGLEEAENPRQLLRELWRVTAEEGRILIIAANRRGLWARADNTPFGEGRPWSRGQLARLLEDSLFQTTAWAHALYMPPLNSPLITSASHTWERAGETLFAPFGGAVMVEAVKRLYIDPRGSAPATVTAAHKAKALTARRDGG